MRSLTKCGSSNVQRTFSFFASQTLHNIKKLKKKSREAKDSAIFPFFILLHKRAKPIHPPYLLPHSARELKPILPLTLSLPSARELKPLTLTLRPPIRPYLRLPIGK
jgi:hypothetical protein